MKKLFNTLDSLKEKCSTRSQRIAFNELVKSFAKEYPMNHKFYNTPEFKLIESLSDDERRGVELSDGETLEFQLYNFLVKVLYRYLNDGDTGWYETDESYPYFATANWLASKIRVKGLSDNFHSVVDLAVLVVNRINEGVNTTPINKAELERIQDKYFDDMQKALRAEYEEDDYIDNESWD